jgi:polyribonucleotide nucleotidyltransferase
MQKTRLARTLILNKISKEAELVEMISQQSNEQKRLDHVQKTIIDGLREEFQVDSELVPLVIGTAGRNIKACKEITGVERVAIMGETGIVRITGPTKESVKQARDLLEYIEKRYPIARTEANQLLQNGGTIAGGGMTKLGKDHVQEESDMNIVSRCCYNAFMYPPPPLLLLL